MPTPILDCCFRSRETIDFESPYIGIERLRNELNHDKKTIGMGCPLTLKSPRARADVGDQGRCMTLCADGIYKSTELVLRHCIRYSY